MAFWDAYEHQDSKTIYILENLKSREIEDSFNDTITGCNCVSECTLENNCSCIERSGKFYKYMDRFYLPDYTLTDRECDKPVYECNTNCPCNGYCGNKLVQYGPRKTLKIVDTNPESITEPPAETKGFGLTTTKPILQGNFICEYAGEVISQNEAQRRFKLYAKMKLMNYIFCIRENFGTNNTKTFIDPTFYGNIGRYINHSCQPNSSLVPIRVDDLVPKLCIFAKQNLEVGTEITFDYGDGDVGFLDDSSNIKRKTCLCMSVNCRKFLPFDTTV